MRLNGLGAPDEVTLVPLNEIEQAQIKTETKSIENTTQNNKEGYCFYCNKFNHFKAECRKTNRDKWQQTRKKTAKPTQMQAKRLNAILAAKRKIVRLERTLPLIRDLSVTFNKKERRITPPNQRQLNVSKTQKTNYPAPALWRNSRREGVFNRRPPHQIYY